MKIGDFVTIVYYIPEDSRYGPLNVCYYGQIIKFIKNTNLFEYAVIAEIDEGTMCVKRGDYKLADFTNVIEVNGRFELNRYTKFMTIAKNNYDKMPRRML